jgi:hypothetical protein
MAPELKLPKFQRDHAERVSRTCMVCVVGSALVSVQGSDSVARGASSGTKVRSC